MKRLASRKDSRVIDLMIAFGPLGYGIYALLVDYLKERKAFRSMADVNRIAYELHADAETLRAVIEDFGLFEIVDGNIIIKNKDKEDERKAPAAAEISEPSENSELSECSEEVIVETPKKEVSSPISETALSASAKRRARRKRLRDNWSHPLNG